MLREKAETEKNKNHFPTVVRYGLGGKQWSRNSYVPYILVALVLGILGFLIFWRSGYIAGGDIWPTQFIPKNNMWQQNWPIWGPTVTGIGSPQYNPTNLVWSMVGQALTFLSLSGPHQQDIFLIALFIFEGVGVTHLMRVVYPSRPIAAVLAALAVTVSLYNTLAFLNPIQAFAIGWFPLSAGIVLRTLPQGFWWTTGIRLGLTSLGLWILVGTPPMAVVWVIWMAVWILVDAWRRHQFRVYAIIVGSIVAILLNGWWAYGAALTLGGGTVQQSFAGPLSWAWVNQRASLLNLATMQGSWSWPQTVYFPWSALYQQGLLAIVLYVPVIMAAISVIWVSERTRWLWVGWIVFALWIGQGTHPPFGWINTWLYEHVPYFWLFRDPQVEMDIILYVGLMILASLLIDELYQRFSRQQKTFSRILSVAVLFVMGTALLSNGYALISGQAIPRQSKGGHSTPSLNIHVPSYWARTAKFLNSSKNLTGRILLLPNDDFYQMPYDWGYYGTDAVAQSYFHAPVVLLNPNPSGYLAGSSGYQATLSQLYSAIRSHPHENIGPLLSALGIHWIVERQDINWQLPNRTILPPSYVLWYLSHQPGIQRVRSIGSLVLYKVRQPAPVVSAASSVGTWSGTAVPPMVVPRQLQGVITQAGPWVAHPLSHVPVSQKIQQIQASKIVHHLTMPSAGSLYVRPKTAQVRVRWNRSQLTVQLRALPLESGRHVMQWIRTLSVSLPSPLPRSLGIQIGGSDYTVSTDTKSFSQGHFLALGSYTFPKESGNTTVTILRGSPISINSSWSPVQNCNAYQNLPPDATQLWEHALTQGGIQLHAREQAACSVKSTARPLASGLIELSVRAMHVSGQAPVVALLQHHHVLMHAVLPSTHTWSTWTQFQQLMLPGRAAIFVYSFGSANHHPTMNDYQVSMTGFQPVVTRTLTLNGALFSVSRGTIVQKGITLSPNLLRHPHFSQGLWGPVFNGDAYRRETLTQAGIQAHVKRGIMTIQAHSDGAGEGQVVTGVGGHIITLQVQARDLHGHPAAIALVNASNGRVLWSQAQSPGQSGWHTMGTVLNLSPSVNTVSFDLYAYGSAGSHGTVIQYRNPSLRVWQAGRQSIWTVSGKPAQRLEPSLIASGLGTQYAAHLNKLDHLVILHTSYSPAWHVLWHNKRVPWKHIVVDGVYNGWVIPASFATSGASIVIRFSPSVPYHVLWVIAWAVVALSVTLLIGHHWRHKKMREEREITQ